MKLIDLHTHSTASDGILSPAELIRAAYQAGLSAISLTDHDTVAGLDEALREADEVGIEFVNGVELSVGERPRSLHLLGYCFDPRAGELQNKIDFALSHRDNRNIQIVEKLAEQGISISRDEMIQAVDGEENLPNIGRPHIANILIRQKVVADFNEAFDRFLGKDGSAYVDRIRLSPGEGIEAIHSAGGLAVMAHPKFCGARDYPELRKLVDWLVSMGLDGLECHYSEHTPEETIRFIELANEHGLLVTGGTDFHGAAHAGVLLGVGNGDMSIPYDLLQALKDRRESMFG